MNDKIKCFQYSCLKRLSFYNSEFFNKIFKYRGPNGRPSFYRDIKEIKRKGILSKYIRIEVCVGVGINGAKFYSVIDIYTDQMTHIIYGNYCGITSKEIFKKCFKKDFDIMSKY